MSILRLSALATARELEHKADKAWMQGNYDDADRYAEQADKKRKEVR